jgi:P-type Ca2+ transporter type 2C
MSRVRNPEASPGPYVRGVDVEGAAADPFDIPAKRAPVERLRRWRVSTV